MQDYVLPILARMNIPERYDIGEIFKENAKLIIEKMQFAIIELEKVKEWLEPKYFDYEQINYLTKIIDQQIKELKGERCNEHK